MKNPNINVYLIDSNEYMLYLVQQTTNKNTLYLNKKNMTFDFLSNLLFKIHLSKRINQIISLPFKWIWFLRSIRKETHKINALIIHARMLNYYENINLIKHIKKNLSPNHIFIYFSDAVDRHNVDISKLKREYSQVFTYSLIEAKKYQILHQVHPYSLNKDHLKQVEIKYDIVFVGNAKNRLNLLHKTFLALKEKGYKVLFLINKVEKNLQLNVEGIIYNNKLNYSENLDLILKSESILEIIDPSNNAPTLRLQEAIYFNKTLITNLVTDSHQSTLKKNQWFLLEDLLEKPKISLNDHLSKKEYNEIIPSFDLDNFSENLIQKFLQKN